MKKLIICSLLLAAATIANAVPAKRGWQTMTQSDGTTIEVQVIGDEFYHYTINRDGQQIRLDRQGMYRLVGDAPTVEQFRARRAQAQARRQRADVGTTPNLAPKGVVILANFNDTKMKSTHTQAVFDELCNATVCTVNSGFPSAAQYFADQSNGSYRPVFDVFGPVTLSHDYAHYGTDLVGYEDGNDTLATDAVVEACILANQQFNIDFTQYDSDNDGYVDFVYVIYAGKGQADGGDANTIWPHNWEIESAIYYQNCTYTREQCKIDGKRLNNYAMSSELSGSALGGIGTLCHEFGHVMGLPDLYDTSYGTNYKKELTPGEWSIMDGGSYNGDGHCPPNYDPWQKYFFGWQTPENLGSEGQALELIANGMTGYQAYQINASGEQQEPTTAGLCYYFENRQKQGWDQYLPWHGLLIWKIDFNASAWTSNAPNNTANNPRYTIVCSNGTRIGRSYGRKNVFPYIASGDTVNSWEGVSGKPLLEITEVGNRISLIYIEETLTPTVTWMVNGEVLETRQYDLGDPLQLPATAVTPCDGTELIGWTRKAQWCDPFTDPDDMFSDTEGMSVLKNVTYYAVFK